MKKRNLLLPTIILLLSAATLWLLYSSGDGPASAPAPAGEAWTGIELPAPSYSPVERLRAKTVAGNDKFIVETREREIRGPLQALQRLFLEPGSPEAVDGYEAVTTENFKASPFIGEWSYIEVLRFCSAVVIGFVRIKSSIEEFDVVTFIFQKGCENAIRNRGRIQQHTVRINQKDSEF